MDKKLRFKKMIIEFVSFMKLSKFLLFLTIQYNIRSFIKVTYFLEETLFNEHDGDDMNIGGFFTANNCIFLLVLVALNSKLYASGLCVFESIWA